MKTLGKTYIDKNVYDSVCDRINFIMRDFKMFALALTNANITSCLHIKQDVIQN